MLKISFGIMTYNEAEILSKLLVAVKNQKTTECQIMEIIVVASGCTDTTHEVVKGARKEDKRIRLLIQKRREGKASAINLFLKKAKYKICVLESGDTIPLSSTVEKLVKPFINLNVGMTGAHPIPINKIKNFISFTVNFNWQLTHSLCMHKPRLGEMIAFRKVFNKIPKDTAVDEACIEAIIRNKNLQIVYSPNAIVKNKAPETIRDYLKQSRRIYAGHTHLQKTMNYEVASKDIKIVLHVLFENIYFNRYFFWCIGAVILEVLGRMLGIYDFYIKKKNPYIWEIAQSTKKM
jgi:poly-beta-1,6-N-acetyl-D-glucosamine synthase